MPADPGVNNGSVFLNLTGELHDLFPGGAIWDQVDHAKPVDHNKIVTHRRAHTAQNF